MQRIFKLEGVRFIDKIAYPDLELFAGETVFIQGRSGSGKSSLLRLLNATRSPSAGKIIYRGCYISKLDTLKLRRAVLLVAQQVYLFAGTIRDNFRAFYAYLLLPAPADSIMQHFLQMCQLDFSLDADTAPMSGGEKQRVYLAIYSSFTPEVLMLDEPTSALDQENALALMQNLQTFCREKNILLLVVSHTEGLAERFADKVITIGEEIGS